MKNGGRRPGAGRKKGSKSRPDILAYFTTKEITQFVADVKKAAKTDSRLKIWLGDQLFHKAPQAIDLTSGGKPLLIGIDET